MSTSTHSDTYPCSWCNSPVAKVALVQGSFCSTECHDAHKADKKAKEVLSHFRRSHIWCGTCFRQLKQIEKPKPDFEFTENGHAYSPDGDAQTLEYYNQDESRQSACGFEYTTENAVDTEKTITVDQYNRERITGTGVGCVCGATSHSQVADELRDRFRIEYTNHLVNAIDAVPEEKLHVDFDTERLFALSIQSLDFQTALRHAINHASL